MARKLKPETILKNFSRYLYGQCGLNSTTVYNHVSAIRRLFPAIGFHPTARKANEILTNMRKAGLSYSHQANTSVALERYGEFSHVRIKLGRPKQPRLLVPNTMSEAEISRILAAGRTDRERAVLVLLAYSGIRNKELCCLRVEDLDTQSQLIRVHGAKTQRDRVVAVVSPCLAVLVDYLKTRNGGPKDWMFLTSRNKNQLQTQDLRKMVRTVAKRAGITKRVYPHLFRHSLATNLLVRDSGILAIKEQLGHVHLQTTMRYLHSTPGRLQEEYRIHCPVYL